MKKLKLRYYILFASIIAVGITIGILYLTVWRDAGVQLPDDVTMKTAYGEEFNFQDMEPKVRLVEFMYTSCPSVCPVTTQRMVHLKQMLEDKGLFGKKVEFISISIDPEKDTPERLQKYMANYGIKKGEGWTFLRGTVEDTRKVADPFRFFFQDRGTDYLVHTSFAYLIDEKNYLVQQIPMGSQFDRDRVYKDIMNLIH